VAFEPVAAAQAPASAPAPPERAAPPREEPGTHVVTSPIVGPFYRAPRPDSDPFVKVGDTVEKGKTLCIVEAMKLMNEIEADVAGVVLEILPQNGQPVEYGERLFVIKPR
ncbi:MAG: acetyl-CoA carboxylase biotin carboxyl carrier protein, partial [Acidobacteria bacterium ACB2]|nr:acetyl-CoA carboxylase biotin carboxyl carrier protein [Acidobacteria bacterium ACB2]